MHPTETLIRWERQGEENLKEEEEEDDDDGWWWGSKRKKKRKKKKKKNEIFVEANTCIYAGKVTHANKMAASLNRLRCAQILPQNVIIWPVLYALYVFIQDYNHKSLLMPYGQLSCAMTSWIFIWFVSLTFRPREILLVFEERTVALLTFSLKTSLSYAWT